MFTRNIIKELNKWSLKEGRKPLILRGARQVGKTSVIHQFSAQFDDFVYLNLERQELQTYFKEYSTTENLVQQLFLHQQKSWNRNSKNLLFIDEIQECPEAIALLRYLYEDAKELHVIAAGSLLDMAYAKEKSFPVGRVEFMVLHPVSFDEFLLATGELQAYELFQKIPIPEYGHQKLLNLFHQYTLIGGMPEVVAHYVENKNITSLPNIYESLIQAYVDDVEKYASSDAQLKQIRHAMLAIFNEAGKRIKFEQFGKSNYGSREMGEALRIIEKTYLTRLIYPATQTQLPAQPDLRKSPRLQILDTGMLNYFTGIQRHLIGIKNLQNEFRGLILEHITGQEILAQTHLPLSRLHFWVRDKKTSMAEVDYVLPYNGQLIPVEVKAGAEGKLRSLHSFIDGSPINFGIRLNANKLQLSKAKTIAGKEFTLLNLPYYCAGKLEGYIEKYFGDNLHL